MLNGRTPLFTTQEKPPIGFFISSQPEAQVFPVFERNYLLLLERVKRGEQLSMPVAKALTKKKQAPLEPEVQKEKLKNLREQLDL